MNIKLLLLHSNSWKPFPGMQKKLVKASRVDTGDSVFPPMVLEDYKKQCSIEMVLDS